MKEVSRTIGGTRAAKWAAAGLAAAALWFGAAAQGNPQKQTSAGDDIELRFAHAGNVAQAPMEVLENWLFVPVRVNESKPVMFELATCEPRTIIDPAPWLPADANPQAPVDFKNTLLTLPDLDLLVPHVDPKSLAGISSIVGRPIGGVLSADVLSKFVVEIEYDRSSIHFDDPKAYQYSGKGVTLPLFVREGIPHIKAKLKLPGHRAIDEEFEIRTEYNDAIAVSRATAAAHKIKMSKIKGFAYPNLDGGRTPNTRAEMLFIGPFAIATPPVEFPEPTGTEALPRGAAIGNLIWKKFRVILDLPHQRMIIETNSSYPNNIELDGSGVAVLAKGPNFKTFEVAGVASRSPGSEAGLQKGDIIAGIDNQAAADLTLADVRTMFADYDHDYKLTVLRANKPLEMKLHTKHLL